MARQGSGHVHPHPRRPGPHPRPRAVDPRRRRRLHRPQLRRLLGPARARGGLPGGGRRPAGVPRGTRLLPRRAAGAAARLLADGFAARGCPPCRTRCSSPPGALTATAVAARALVRPGDRVLVESPGYPNAATGLRRRRGPAQRRPRRGRRLGRGPRSSRPCGGCAPRRLPRARLPEPDGSGDDRRRARADRARPGRAGHGRGRRRVAPAAGPRRPAPATPARPLRRGGGRYGDHGGRRRASPCGAGCGWGGRRRRPGRVDGLHPVPADPGPGRPGARAAGGWPTCCATWSRRWRSTAPGCASSATRWRGALRVDAAGVGVRGPRRAGWRCGAGCRARVGAAVASRPSARGWRSRPGTGVRRRGRARLLGAGALHRPGPRSSRRSAGCGAAWDEVRVGRGGRSTGRRGPAMVGLSLRPTARARQSIRGRLVSAGWPRAPRSP